MEKLPLIELAELNKSIIFRDSFQDIFSIADLDGGMDIGDPDSPERFAPMRLNALLMGHLKSIWIMFLTLSNRTVS